MNEKWTQFWNKGLSTTPILEQTSIINLQGSNGM